MGVPASLVDLHRRNNRDTAGSWERFAAHRARVTALAAGAGQGRLAVLGAGNCNDLDLAALVGAGRYREIHLADLDAAALERAVGRQPDAARGALRIHAPVDLSGALSRVSSWRARPPTPAQLGALPQAAADQARAALPGPFDVVLSACFLSQLMRTCYVALGGGHPHLHAVAAALALGHLRLLVSLAAPGGTVLLVTDAATSETYPLEELFAERDGEALLRELEESGNVFAGTGPGFVESMLRADPRLAPRVGEARLEAPWLWPFSEERTYLVYAVSISVVSSGAGGEP